MNLIALGGVSAREHRTSGQGRSGTKPNQTIAPFSAASSIPALGFRIQEKKDELIVENMQKSWESACVRTVVGVDAVVVDHAAGVEGVAGLLAGAAAVQDPAVLPVPQQRRDFHFSGTRAGGHTHRGKEKQARQYTLPAGEHPTES